MSYPTSCFVFPFAKTGVFFFVYLALSLPQIITKGRGEGMYARLFFYSTRRYGCT